MLFDLFLELLDPEISFGGSPFTKLQQRSAVSDMKLKAMMLPNCVQVVRLNFKERPFSGCWCCLGQFWAPVNVTLWVNWVHLERPANFQNIISPSELNNTEIDTDFLEKKPTFGKRCEDLGVPRCPTCNQTSMDPLVIFFLFYKLNVFTIHNIGNDFPLPS